MKITVTVESGLIGMKVKKTATVEKQDVCGMVLDGMNDYEQNKIKETTKTLLEALNGR